MLVIGRLNQAQMETTTGAYLVIFAHACMVLYYDRVFCTHSCMHVDITINYYECPCIAS